MAELSYQANALLTRLRSGAWYDWRDDRTPKAMEELEAAGLVKAIGRAAKVVRCWVPSEAVYVNSIADMGPEVADIEALVAACESEFIGDICLAEPDADSVSHGADGGSIITFGHIRRARRALSVLRGEG